MTETTDAVINEALMVYILFQKLNSESSCGSTTVFFYYVVE